MRSRGPEGSPRASSYAGPPFLKCATGSWAPPSSRRNHRMVTASRPHARISAAQSMLASCGTSQGGGAPGGARTRRLARTVWGSSAACSQSVVSASHGRSGPAPLITVGRGRVCGSHPSSGTAAYYAAGVLAESVVVHHLLHSRVHSAPTMCASHAVMELRPMIHRWKSAPRRCFWETPGQVPVGMEIFLGGTLQSALYQAEGGHEIPAGGWWMGGTVRLRRREV